jgi:hypothetical protein
MFTCGHCHLAIGLGCTCDEPLIGQHVFDDTDLSKFRWLGFSRDALPAHESAAAGPVAEDQKLSDAQQPREEREDPE